MENSKIIYAQLKKMINNFKELCSLRRWHTYTETFWRCLSMFVLNKTVYLAGILRRLSAV